MPRQYAEATPEPRQPVGAHALELQPQQRLAKRQQQRQTELLPAVEHGARDEEGHRAQPCARAAARKQSVKGKLLQHDHHKVGGQVQQRGGVVAIGMYGDVLVERHDVPRLADRGELAQ